MWRIVPKEEKFFELFEQGAQNAHTGAKLLHRLLNDFTDVEQRAREIEGIEHEGDRITHEIMGRLNKTFLTPIDREDIHLIAKELDNVIDLIEASADRLYLYKIAVISEDARILADLVLKSTEEVCKAVEGLRELKKGKSIKHCVEINRLENEADRVYRLAIARLFENGTDAIEAFKWKEIYDHLETATDACEDVANLIEGVAMKYA
ncbi:MAG: DUF47 domain-containing protein [Syntrophothermus sp.]